MCRAGRRANDIESVDNEPQKIRGLKLGQLVLVNSNEISDWLYTDGKLVGGYTVRAHIMSFLLGGSIPAFPAEQTTCAVIRLPGFSGCR